MPIFRPILWTLLASLLLPAGVLAEPADEATKRGSVSVFVSGSKRAGKGGSLRVTAVVAEPDEGEAVALTLDSTLLEPRALARQQQPLASGELDAGLYRAVRLMLLPGPGDDVEPVEVRLVTDFRVWPDETATLIVDWDLKRATDREGRFQPSSLTLRNAGETVRSLVLYVLDGERNELFAVNRVTDKVFASIPVGKRPSNVVFSPLGLQAFVSNSGDDTISVIDPSVQRVIDTYPLRAGSRPEHMALTSDGRKLLVACPGRETIAVVDTRTNAFVGEISLPRAPGRIALSRDDRRVFALLPDGNQLIAADVVRQQASNPVGLEGKPSDLAVDRRTGNVYVTHATAPIVSVFSSLPALRERLEVGFQAHGILLERNSSNLFLSGGEAGGVAIVNAQVGVITQLIPTPPAYRLAADPGGRKIYVSAGARGKFLVIDKVAGRLTQEVRLGSSLIDLAAAP